jgi:hypothetical protein
MGDAGRGDGEVISDDLDWFAGVDVEVEDLKDFVVGEFALAQIRLRLIPFSE